ncbi:MAG TPA: AAA family ATPase [Ottowia sp.]|nr:AAA family ATPase [Ottowia sp.]
MKVAAHAAGLNFDAFDDWSRQAGNYDARACRDTWRSFKSGKGIGPGTLYALAAEHGYTSDKKPQQGRYSARSKPAAPERTQAPGMSPADVWGRCEPVTESHAYASRKGLSGEPLAGLRVVPQGDALRIRGNSMAGALAVPAYAADGTLQSLQLIPADGPKMNLPGAPMAGASFTVGTPEPGRPLYVCEGIGQAWACWQATGAAAMCAFGWGNVARVAAELRQQGQAVVICPDVGKEADADKLARELHCTVAKLPEGWPQNSDVNDYAQREGADALAALLEQASEPAKPEPLLKPVDVVNVIREPSPPPRFVWEGYCPRGEVTLFGAHGGTGKSTIALMLAAAVATGRPLFGVATERAAVVFASLEDGAAVVRHRLAHICRQWQIEPQELAGLHIVDGTEAPELFTAEGRNEGRTTAAYAELRALVNATGAGLVIVDNASDAYGGDEIQRRSVRAFVRGLAAIARDVDAACLLLAHVDKTTSRAGKADNSEGYSGSTAWHNSARSRLFMGRAADGALTLEHQKSNHGRKREPLALRWPEHGLPEADAAPTGVVAHIAERVDTVALLKLIAEFTERSEFIAPGTTSPSNAARLLAHESIYPNRKPREVFDLLRRAERAGYIERTSYRDAQRKTRERWHVTSKGRTFAGLAPTAPTAPTTEEGADSAPVAPTAPTAQGGMGGARAHKEGAATADACPLEHETMKGPNHD